MPTVNYSPSSAAAAVGVSPGTIRAWCAQFRAHLSPRASPDAGKERVLTAGDVAKLQMIKGWRDEGLEVAEILERLTVDPTAPLQPFIDVPAAPVAQDAPQDAQDLRVSELAPIHAIVQALQPFEARIAKLEARPEQKRFDVQSFAFGMIVMGLMILLFIGIAWIVRQ